ncbi:MAG: hypothetical protein XD40_2353, partial [Archaeoglobus fulgidus]
LMIHLIFLFVSFLTRVGFRVVK